MPSLAAGIPYWLSSAAMRMSVSIATCMPPPRQKPRMQEMVGLGKLPSSARCASLFFEYSSEAAALWRVFSNWLMSAPDTKALSPAPTRITTRTSGSSRNSVRTWPTPSHISSDIALRFSGLLKVRTPTPSLMLLRIFPSAKDLSVLVTSSIGGSLWLEISGGEGTDICAREGRARLYLSPPFRHAGMVLFGYLIRRDLFIDPLDERNRRDIGDRKGLADQPAGGRQCLF